MKIKKRCFERTMSVFDLDAIALASCSGGDKMLWRLPMSCMAEEITY